MNTSTPVISVIVPVYNIRKFLPKCIESILRQTYSDFELLLINDGSTDESGAICDKYALYDNRITVIHKKNSGVSEARNSGIKNSKGKFVCFIDGDDYIENDMLEELFLQYNSNNCHLTVCGFQCEDEKGNLLYKTNSSNTYSFDTDSAICSLFDDSIYRYQGYVWNKLFSMEIINKFQLNFNSKIHFNEDRLFCFEYILHCKSVSYSTNIKYHHIFYSSNTMSSINRNGVFNTKYLTDLDAFKIMNIEIYRFNKRTQSFFWHRYIESALKIYLLMAECKYFDSEVNKQIRRIVSKGITFDYIRYVGIKSFLQNLIFKTYPPLYNKLK
ncbi:glycosyltransferase family 2 protein [Bacteroides sedimenti]|uniref:glycosyltransferase family 2 protein n=1 Tax=Bacteroides sedimenti TaxID=2136147 RepID=UPI00333E6A69